MEKRTVRCNKKSKRHSKRTRKQYRKVYKTQKAGSHEKKVFISYPKIGFFTFGNVYASDSESSAPLIKRDQIKSMPKINFSTSGNYLIGCILKETSGRSTNSFYSGYSGYSSHSTGNVLFVSQYIVKFMRSTELIEHVKLKTVDIDQKDYERNFTVEYRLCKIKNYNEKIDTQKAIDKINGKSKTIDIQKDGKIIKQLEIDNYPNQYFKFIVKKK